MGQHPAHPFQVGLHVLRAHPAPAPALGVEARNSGLEGHREGAPRGHRGVGPVDRGPESQGGGAATLPQGVAPAVAPAEEGHGVVLTGAVQVQQQVGGADHRLAQRGGEALGGRTPLAPGEDPGQVEPVSRSDASPGLECRGVGHGGHQHPPPQRPRVEISPDGPRRERSLVFVPVHPAQDAYEGPVPAPPGQEQGHFHRRPVRATWDGEHRFRLRPRRGPRDAHPGAAVASPARRSRRAPSISSTPTTGSSSLSPSPCSPAGPPPLRP